MTIKQRLLLLSSFVVLMSLIMLGLFFHNNHRNDHLRHALVVLMDVEADMHALHALEQNYLLTHGASSYEGFHEEVESLREELHELEESLEVLGLDTQRVDELMADLDATEDHFDQLSTLVQYIGLDESKGLRGSLRAAAHQVEATFRELGAFLDDYRYLSQLLMLRRHEKDFMLRLNPQYVDKFDQAYTELATLIRQTLPEVQQDDPAWANLTAYTEMFQRLVQNKRQLGLNEQEGLRGQLNASVASIITNQKALMRDTYATIERLRKEQNILFLGGTVGLAVLLTLFTLLTARGISTRLGQITQAMEQVAEGQADLKTSLPEQGRDEVTRIASAFNRFTLKLADTVQQILMIASNLSQGSQRAQDITRATSNAIEEQVEAITRLNDKIGQMAESSQQVQAAIGETRDTVHEVQGKAAEGLTVVEDAVQGMQDMQNEIACLEQSIGTLTQHHENVGKILDMIVTIAEQTNLLALNAAIEAARAGDAGRGFAVVADEVRALSQRTTQATEEIRTLMDTIRTGNEEAVSLMNRSVEASSHNLQRTQAAGEVFRLITGAVDDIKQRNTTIAGLSEQQTAMANDVYANIRQIHATVHELSELARKNISDNGDLSQFSVQLEFLVAGLSNQSPTSLPGPGSTETEEEGDVELF